MTIIFGIEYKINTLAIQHLLCTMKWFENTPISMAIFCFQQKIISCVIMIHKSKQLPLIHRSHSWDNPWQQESVYGFKLQQCNGVILYHSSNRTKSVFSAPIFPTNVVIVINCILYLAFVQDIWVHTFSERRDVGIILLREQFFSSKKINIWKNTYIFQYWFVSISPTVNLKQIMKM